MKLIEKIILVVYSFIMLIFSTIVCLLIFRLINIASLNNFFSIILNNGVFSIITVIICVSFILASIKCIFFLSKKSDLYKDNILLKNEEGNLKITKTTIENLTINSLNGFASIKDMTVKVKFDKQNDILINICILADENVKMQELTQNIRNKLKNTVKTSTGLEIKEINIKIKDIKVEKNIIQE